MKEKHKSSTEPGSEGAQGSTKAEGTNKAVKTKVPSPSKPKKRRRGNRGQNNFKPVGSDLNH